MSYIPNIKPCMLVKLRNTRYSVIVNTTLFGVCIYDADGTCTCEPLRGYTKDLENIQNENLSIDEIYGYASDHIDAVLSYFPGDRELLWSRENNSADPQGVDCERARIICERCEGICSDIQLATANGISVAYDPILERLYEVLSIMTETVKRGENST